MFIHSFPKCSTVLPEVGHITLTAFDQVDDIEPVGLIAGSRLLVFTKVKVGLIQINSRVKVSMSKPNN